jgi:hypothetical protein
MISLHGICTQSHQGYGMQINHLGNDCTRGGNDG